MLLKCLVDKCPITNHIVSYSMCCNCKYNPLEYKQPLQGMQLCEYDGSFIETKVNPLWKWLFQKILGG